MEYKKSYLVTAGFLLLVWVSSRSGLAAEVAAIERDPVSDHTHVLIDEGVLHGYLTGKQVCILSPVGENIFCGPISRSNDIFSLIAVPGDLASKIEKNALVRAVDFVPVRPKISAVCRKLLADDELKNFPDDDRISFDLFKKQGFAGLCPESTVGVRSGQSAPAGMRAMLFTTQVLIRDTTYNRVGFRKIEAGKSRGSHWGGLNSEVPGSGYAASVTTSFWNQWLLNLSVRTVGPVSEDLSDDYKEGDSDRVTSRTEYESYGLSAVATRGLMLTDWLTLEYGAGLDVNATTVRFKSFRSGKQEQLLARAQSKKTFIGPRVEMQAVFNYKSANLIMGVDGVIPLFTVGKSYEEEIDDIDDSAFTGSSPDKSVEKSLAHDHSKIGFSGRLGLGVSF